MTIEEKARAYDEALEDMRVIYPNLRGDAKLAVEHAFPELVEGEDDRIKKIITDSVFYLYGAGVEYKDTLDYLDKLEKRKETGIQWLKSDNAKNPDKPYIDKAGMFYTTDGRMCHASEIEKRKAAEWGELQWGELQSEFKNINEAFEDGKREVVAHPERYGLCECVPAEWGEEDSDNLERVDNYLWMLDDYVGDDCAMPQGKAYNIRENIQEVLSPWLKSLPGSFNLQPRQEWSEEDEDMFVSVLHFLNTNRINERGKVITWVESLPKRFSLQPKPEWSEEDERKLQKCIKIVERWEEDYDIAYAPYSNTLKSLRSQSKKELSIEKAIQWLDDTFYFSDNSSGRGRDCEITTHDFDSLEEMYDSFRKAVIVDSEPHWKPTEEQIRTLDIVISDYRHACTKDSDKKAEILKPLLEQLEKL